MIPREKRVELLQLFSNAARIGDIETMTQAEINKLSPKLRKIFQAQYDAFHSHFPDEMPEDSPSIDDTGVPKLPVLLSVSGVALNKAFKSTEKEFKEVLVEHTSTVYDKAAEKIQRQLEPVAKAIDPEFKIEWDRSDPKAHEKLVTRAADMVTKIDDVTRQDIHDIIVRGTEEKRTYTQIAEDIRTKYSEFSEPKPQAHIRDRAELIAVNEIGLAAQSAGYDENMAFFDDGWDVEKFWNNTGDEKVSDGCLENTDAGWIPLDEPFPGEGEVMFPPRFPGCRCALSFRMLGRKK